MGLKLISSVHNFPNNVLIGHNSNIKWIFHLSESPFGRLYGITCYFQLRIVVPSMLLKWCLDTCEVLNIH